MTAKIVKKEIKKMKKNVIGSKKESVAVVSEKTVQIQVKRTRCETAIQDIIKMTTKCEKGTEQIEFYTFTALDQCLKRLTGFCPQN